MNRVVVIRAAAGLAAYLQGQRRHRRLRGDRVRRPAQLRRLRPRHRRGDDRRRAARRCVLPRPLPTPLLAFAIRELGCVAGVMVTASHNPPQDNGYKVYLGDGSQIVPPADAEIAARIAAVGAAGRRAPRRRPARSSARTSSTATSTPSPGSPATARATCDLVYTPLHGVGGTSVLQVLETAGFARAARGRAAGAARPRLPDRRVPQPRGAGRDGPRDGARRGARRRPRGRQRPRRRPVRRRRARPRTAGGCCAATRSARCSAHHLLRRGQAAAPTPRSIVSSSLLGKMAAAAGQPYVETLTGFKWIGRVAGPRLRLRGGARLLRATPSTCRTRTASRRCCCSASWRAEPRPAGRTLRRRARRHRRRARPARHRPALGPGRPTCRLIAAAMERLRDDPAHRARRSRGRAGRRPRRSARADLPPTDGLRYRLADGARVDRRARAAPSRSSSATSRSSSRSTPTAGVDAARISAAGRLDALARGHHGGRSGI